MSVSSKTRDNFKVAVRVRPLISREVASGSTACVEVDGEHRSIIVNKPAIKKRNSRIGFEDFGELVRADPDQTATFSFDVVYHPGATQEDVFQNCACDIVTSVLEGYNGSIIASGQTSSGKTYTIEGGSGEERGGIIPRATELIFSRIRSCVNKGDQFLVRTSFLELYNEKISDLLDPRRENLRIREDGVGGVFVDNLSEHIVRSTEEVMKTMQEGARLRTTATTRMNKESSRSHAVFTIIVEHAEHDGSGGNVVTIGKLRLVDLAGSERLDIDAQSKQQEETKNINVSLHTFGRVVTALTTPGTKYIPYRDSKLTHLLQDSLGGNCKTSLIATITPVADCYSESLNTLKFAKRAKSIKNVASVNRDMSEKALLSAYQAEIKQLKSQLQDRVYSSEELQQLQQERLQAQREKEDFKSKLIIQEKIAIEAKADKDRLVSRIQELEDKLLHGGKQMDVTESDEFKQALQKEQERLKKKTELKLAELEKEKQRLEQERMAILKQREQIAMQESVAATTNFIGMSQNQSFSETNGMSPTPREMSAPKAKSVLSAPKAKSAWSLQRGPSHNSWVPSSIEKETDYDGSSTPVNPFQLDADSLSALQIYEEALAHPRTGIPCQELVSGVQMFTGTAAIHWFMKNMEGISTVQSAQAVGQRLMDLGVFSEIQGRANFVVSDAIYYQFRSSRAASGTGLGHTASGRRLRAKSMGSFPDSRGRYNYGSGFAAKTAQSSTWSVSSSVSSMSQSVASLGISGDLLEHFGLSDSHPTQLHVAALYGDKAQIKALLSQININVTDACGRTPLAYAVIGKQAKCCILLVRSGADINLPSSTGCTPLLLAAKYEYEDIIKLLMKSGAKTHHTDRDGSTVFHVAARSQNYKCLEYLCKYGSELLGINARDYMYRTPIHIAVLAKLPGHVKRLLVAKADLGVSDQNGRTALHYAVTCNSLPCAQAIVETNPNDINLVDTHGCSALHLGCKEGSSEIVSYLSSFPGCDLNIQDQSGCTPLHYAVFGNLPNTVKILIPQGASTTIMDSSKKTPLHYSMEMGHEDCTQALQAPSHA